MYDMLASSATPGTAFTAGASWAAGRSQLGAAGGAPLETLVAEASLSSLRGANPDAAAPSGSSSLWHTAATCASAAGVLAAVQRRRSRRSALVAGGKAHGPAVVATSTSSTAMHATRMAEAGASLLEPLPKGKPLKVVIAGGGVGGLTTALAMLKEGFDVQIYEKAGTFARFGGPIQFASNTTSTLKAIDERLFQRVMQKFQFTATRRCGIKDGLRADGSFRMTDVQQPEYLVNPETPADWYVAFPLKECADFFELPYTGVIERPDLQDILLDECRSRKKDFITNGNGVVGYTNHDKGVTVKLQDGSTVEADVLVGADGIWSAVRAQMYNEGAVKQQAPDGWSCQECPYTGYTVFAGEAVMDLPDYYECGYKVYIGPEKYFVTSDVGNGRIQWYAFLAMEPGSKKAADSWEGQNSSAKQGNDVISYLKGLHEGWTSEVAYVLDNTPAESVEQRDLYDRWPEFFRSWADGNVVLMGDAVHPMMPNLGQGGGMAIEDAYELTKGLKAVQLYAQKETDPKINAKALQDFYNRRVGRVAGVSVLSRLASELLVRNFDTPWSPHDDKGSSIKSYMTFIFSSILQYIVFPLQFLFLYSYHPSGGMGDMPKRLEAEWRKRHKVDAEEAFEKVRREGQTSRGPSFFAKFNEDVPVDASKQVA
eukprot:TRINITY_DN8060_c0_g1_i1.p1 TRINITY_DN8060_c0_g1~~TRINITY_DN8060_c0_g1_i1.p1  ORF type:complete len:654 (+),score=164.64 TRINITY_DN8060_c0_g1_i1:75-2036(+)